MPYTWKRLAGPAQLTDSAATKYTVPSATKTIVRHLHFSNPGGGSSRTITWSIGADAAGTRLLDAYPIAAGTVVDVYGSYVMETTEILQALCSAASAVTLTVFGEENTLG